MNRKASKQIALHRATGAALRPTPGARNRGASLIEVLVAMTILAIGLLGQAALQITSLQRNQSALQRSQATLLAYDLADRMRSNRGATLEGRYDDGSKHASRLEWDDAVARIFGPAARGTVERDETVVSIAVSWDDTRADIRRGTTRDAPEGSDPTPPIEPGPTDPISLDASGAPDTPYDDGHDAAPPADDVSPGSGATLTRYAYHTRI